MAKKTVKKPKKEAENELLDQVLPQNIVEFGEATTDEKKIYISQSAYQDIHKFTKDKKTNESGGILIGNVIEEFGKMHIIIRAFVEAKYCEGTPTTLKFTHETWEYVHKEVDKKYPQYKILGWIHTHPDFGIFLSEYDKFIQQNFFKEENQIAYVVDPIQNIEGFYCWINDKIERCNGFYVFDKTGVKIKVGPDMEPETKEAPAESDSVLKTIVICLLSVAVVALMFFTLRLSNKLDKMEDRLQEVQESMDSMSQQYGSYINQLSSNDYYIQEILQQYHPEAFVVESEPETAVEESAEESSEAAAETQADTQAEIEEETIQETTSETMPETSAETTAETTAEASTEPAVEPVTEVSTASE